MKLTIFRSSKGDCLLISHPAGNGKNNNILVDGGMTTSFNNSVAPYLNQQIKANNEVIDLLCLSHIDADHIVGVLTLMKLLTDWRVFNHHQNTNPSNDDFKKPKHPEPPTIKSIWHNSFAKSYNLGATLPRVTNALYLIEQATIKYLDNALLEEVHQKATGIKQGITLSQRIQPEQLNIALNPQFNGKLVKCNQRSIKKNSHKIGDLTITIIGPFTSDLNDLKDDWKAWEKKHRTELIEFYANLNLTSLDQPLGSSELSQLLIDSGSIDLSLGNRGEVSIPNLASIMFLIEVDNKSILLTGDGHADDILKGLKKNKKLNNSGSIHVDVLKIQHHGASANIHEKFCKKITADHYVFCGNGTHTNPEAEVIDLIFNSRRGSEIQKSNNEEVVDNPFTFWFSANPEDELTNRQKEHLEMIADKLTTLKASDATFDFNFMPIGDASQSIVLL